jgi:hypothetical protein
MAPISGTNNTQFVLEAAQFADGGQYRMHAVGVCDTNLSLPALVSVLVPPNLSTISGPTTADTVTTQTYSVSPLAGVAYDWQITNGQLISGQQTNQVNVKWNALSNTVISIVASVFPGCADTASLSVTIVNPVGLSDINQSRVKIFPNPSTGVVFFDAPQPIDAVRIYSLDGRLLYSYESIVNNRITISQTGMFVIEVLTRDGIVRQKIVIE